MNVLVDTTVLIDVLRGRRGRRRMVSTLIEQGAYLCSCDITLAEVYSGMRDNEHHATDELLTSLYYVPADPDVARSAGLMRGRWRRHGVTLSVADTFVAAVALRHDLAVLTDNARDFPEAGLVVLTPDRVG